MIGRWVFINEANSYNFFIGNNPFTPLYKTWWFGSHGPGDPDFPVGYQALLAEIQSQPLEAQSSLYFKTAVEHIMARPDLFLIRTASRIRSYFAFDTFAGSALINGYSINKFVGLIVIFADACFYCMTLIMAIRALFDADLRASPYVGFLVLLAVLYALPYWLSFSHPTYHFPVVPLFGILAMHSVEKSVQQSDRENSWSWIALQENWLAFRLVGLIFASIQLEWIFTMWSRIYNSFLFIQDKETPLGCHD